MGLQDKADRKLFEFKDFIIYSAHIISGLYIYGIEQLQEYRYLVLVLLIMSLYLYHKREPPKMVEQPQPPPPPAMGERRIVEQKQRPSDNFNYLEEITK